MERRAFPSCDVVVPDVCDVGNCLAKVKSAYADCESTLTHGIPSYPDDSLGSLCRCHEALELARVTCTIGQQIEVCFEPNLRGFELLLGGLWTDVYDYATAFAAPPVHSPLDDYKFQYRNVLTPSCRAIIDSLGPVLARAGNNGITLASERIDKYSSAALGAMTLGSSVKWYGDVVSKGPSTIGANVVVVGNFDSAGAITFGADASLTGDVATAAAFTAGPRTNVTG
jgi:hypothetical protein